MERASTGLVLVGTLIAGGKMKPFKLKSGDEHVKAWVRIGTDTGQVFVSYWTPEEARQAIGAGTKPGDVVELPVVADVFKGAVSFNGRAAETRPGEVDL